VIDPEMVSPAINSEIDDKMPIQTHKDTDTLPYRLHCESPTRKLPIIESPKDSPTSYPGKASGPIDGASPLRYLPSGPVDCEAETASR
jgi:hypothetical protein